MATSDCVKPRLPRLDTSLQSPVEEPMPDQLVSAIAQVLGIQRDSILLYDSFSELGGDGATAGDLVASCSTLGLTLTESDVLRCKTIAELQTCLRPSQSAAPGRLSISSPSVQSGDDVSSRISETFSLEQRKSSDGSELSHSPCRRSRSSSRYITADDFSLAEELLVSTSQVPRAAVILPRAGYFEGKLVAFLTLAGISGSVQECNPRYISPIPQRHHHYAGSQVAALRYLLENSTAIAAVPAAWIVLEQMPLTQSGNSDRRRLQTWIQNMNEDLFQQIMSVENQELLQEPSTDMERSLQRFISSVLKSPIERIGMNFSFKQLGGDEFSALQLVAECRSKGILLSTDDIAQSDSIAHLAFLASYKRASSPSAWEDEGTSSFGLSPMQQLYFQTSVGGDYEARRTRPWDYRFNQSMLLQINSRVDLDDVNASIEAIAGHHPMLRARFQLSQGARWTQSIVASIPGSYHFNHHVVSTNDQVLEVIRQSQALVDIESGPLFAAELIRTTDGEQMLYLVAHHLVVDLTSWRVIIHDLNELLQNGSLLSARGMSFQRWNELQEAEIKSSGHIPSLPFDTAANDLSFWGLDLSRNVYGNTEEVSFSLAAELSTILQTTCNEALRTDSTDIYLAALLLSFCQTFPERAPPIVWNQEHGREPWDPEIDITETVGWFTTICPLRLDTDSSEDFIGTLRRMKDARRAIPRRGWSYFASRFLGPDSADTCGSPYWPFEVMFTYGGSLQQLEPEGGMLEQLPIPGRTLDSTTSDIGPGVGRAALFEVSTIIDHGVTNVKFLYNRESGHQSRITEWISNYEHLLLEAIGRLRYRAQELTLTDVPLLNVTYDGLAKLSDRLQRLNIASARDIENMYPVTPIQQELLISQSQSPETCHIHAIFEFPPALDDAAVDAPRLCAAWQQTVAKYPSLRTVFIDSASEDGLYDQVVLRKCSPTMLFIEAGPTTSDALAALNDLPPLQCAPFEPRHRLAFCKTGASTFLKLEVSQAICDTASLERIVSDVRRAYSSNTVSTQNLELSYSSYVNALQEARDNSTVEFWRDQLRDQKPCLFPALSTADNGRQRVTTVKSDISMGDLDAYCRRVSVKRATVLRVAWGLVLRNYTGSKHVCFGFRNSGRDAPRAPLGLDTAVGSFETTIICSLDLSASKTLESVVQEAEDQLSLYLPHQFTSISEIEHALSLSGAPLFNTCFTFHDEHRGLKSRFSIAQPQSQVRYARCYNTLDHDISVSVSVSNGMLEMTLAHRALTSLQAESVAVAFGCAVRAVLGSADGSVGGVDLFSEHDRAQLATPVTQTQDSKARLPVHEIVELMIKDDPDAPAVAAWDGRLCYRQLTRLISRLALYLIELGIEPGSPVPVVVGKNRWSSVAILAVLKSGGCFVPLDEDDAAFAQKIVRQLKSGVVLVTDVSVGKSLESHVESSIVVVEEALFSKPLLAKKECPHVEMGDAACMMFHSPSGKSKEARGILFTHESLSAALVAQGPALGINVASRVLQLSSFASDTALSEVLTTLVHGGCVCVPATLERTDDLAGAIQRLEATWMYMTPVLARRLLPAMAPTIRTVCFRTRRLDGDTLSLWAPKTRVLLSYGTSDICPLGISVAEVTAADQLSRIAPPFIGKFWVVNPEDHRRLMPVGAMGELVVESPTLAHKTKSRSPREVLVRARQTRGEDRAKSRFFKTGHRVRYMDDGTLDFITSSRDNVSLNGNVIPVPAVEQHVRRSLGPGAEVVVDVVRSRDGVSVLAAFVELGIHFEGSEDLEALSSTTKERTFVVKKIVESYFQAMLPSYMLPAAFIPIRYFPMTSSLKIHRGRMQKLAGGRTESELLAIATVPDPEGVNIPDIIKPLPLTQVEEKMRAIWAGLLGVDPETVSGTQSFCRLGGDAYLAAKLVVACRNEGLAIPLGDVLQNTSLTRLCQSITLSEELSTEVVPESRIAPLEVSPTIKHIISNVAPEAGIDSSSIVDVAAATAPQVRSLESALRATRPGINHVVLSFSGVVDSKRIEAACCEVARAHPILRTGFVTHGHKVYQVVTNPPSGPDFSRVQCPSRRLAAVMDRMIKKDQAASVHLGKPVTKFTFFDSGKQSMLTIRLSTTQYDTSSLPVLLQDFRQIYEGGQTSISRPSFLEFARSVAQTGPQAISYWSGLLQGANITPVLMHTKPPKPASTPRTLTSSIPMSPATTSELGITIDTVLKAAWSVVLATLSSTPDVTFGEVIDARHGATGVLGPLHNLIPVRVLFGEQGTPLDLLRSVHEQRLASTPHENLGINELVEKCTPWPYWSRVSTVVRHSGSPSGLGDAARFKIGNGGCTVTVIESAFRDIPDLSVSSEVSGNGEVSVSITFCESRIPTSFAQTALDMLISTMASLTNLHDAVIPSAEDICRAAPQIPLPHLDVDETTHHSSPPPQADHEEYDAVKDIISRAWDALLRPAHHGVPEEHRATAAFYDIWGSLVPAHLLADRITADLSAAGYGGVSVSMEEFVENSSQGGQVGVVLRKMTGGERGGGERRGKRSSSAAAWKNLRILSPRRESAADGGAGGDRSGGGGRIAGGGATVSPVPEDGGVVFSSSLEDGISPLSPPCDERMQQQSCSAEVGERGLMRRASRVFTRMSRMGMPSG